MDKHSIATVAMLMSMMIISGKFLCFILDHNDLARGNRRLYTDNHMLGILHVDINNNGKLISDYSFYIMYFFFFKTTQCLFHENLMKERKRRNLTD